MNVAALIGFLMAVVIGIMLATTVMTDVENMAEHTTDVSVAIPEIKEVPPETSQIIDDEKSGFPLAILNSIMGVMVAGLGVLIVGLGVLIARLGLFSVRKKLFPGYKLFGNKMLIKGGNKEEKTKAKLSIWGIKIK